MKRLTKLFLLCLCLAALSACALRGRGRATQAPAPATETPPPAQPAAPPAADTPTSVPLAAQPAAPSPVSEPVIQAVQFKPGRNDYTIPLEGVQRKVIVYVPAGYDPQRPTPVVFMIHGSNQSGEVMYENTAWARKADQENILIVYPTSWKYRMLDSGRVEDKWNNAQMHRLVAPGAELKDDVRFMRLLLEYLKASFNVDAQRIYASGFSNGGNFVQTRLMPEMNDVFAAYAVAGSGIWLGEEYTDSLPTGIDASLYTIIGTNDAKVAEATGASLPFPFQPAAIAADPFFSQLITNLTSMLSLENSYTLQQRPGSTVMVFDKSTAGAHNQWIFQMVNNIAHVYPNGENNKAGINASDLFWEFFQQYMK